MKHNRRQLFRIIGLVLAANAIALLLLAPHTLANVVVTNFTAAGTEDEIVLAWHTETEIDTLGFNVWRSENEYSLLEMEGYPIDAETVNIGLIAPTGGTSPADYQLIDDDVEQEVTYYYYLSEIITTGVEKFHKGPTAASLVLNEEIGLPTATPATAATATQTATATATPAASATATPTQSAATPNAAATPEPVATLAATGADSDSSTNPPEDSAAPEPAPVEETGLDDAYPADAVMDDSAGVAAESLSEPAALGSADTDNSAQAIASADSSAEADARIIGQRVANPNLTSDVATTTSSSDTQPSSSTRTALIMGSAFVFVIVLLAIAALVLLLLRRRQA